MFHLQPALLQAPGQAMAQPGGQMMRSPSQQGVMGAPVPGKLDLCCKRALLGIIGQAVLNLFS